MAIASMQLDPNAVAYSDDEIVGKVNTATATVSADKIADGTTNKAYTGTEKTKLSGVEAGATNDQSGAEIKTAYEAETGAYNSTKDSKLTGIEAGATADQTGAEVQTAILGLADADRQLIKTSPASGEFYILNIQRDAAGKLDVDYESVPKS